MKLSILQTRNPSVVIYTAIKKGKSPAINCVHASMDNTWSQLPPPICTWVLGIELKNPGLYGKGLIWAISPAPLSCFKCLWTGLGDTHQNPVSKTAGEKAQGSRHLPCRPADLRGAPGSTREERMESPMLSSGPNTHTINTHTHTKLTIRTELKKGQNKKRILLPRMTCGIMMKAT